MIRVTSGIAKGRQLILPKNQKITSVKEVVKLAIFSILGDKITAATCLDLYSGSGNLGIEAISRGCLICHFVDESKASIAAIEQNLTNLGVRDKAEVFWNDSLRYLDNCQGRYDVIFADPYYLQPNQTHLIKLCLSKLKPHGVFFLLTAADNTGIQIFKEFGGMVDIDTRKYGRTALHVLTSRH